MYSSTRETIRKKREREKEREKTTRRLKKKKSCVIELNFTLKRVASFVARGGSSTRTVRTSSSCFSRFRRRIIEETDFVRKFIGNVADGAVSATISREMEATLYYCYARPRFLVPLARETVPSRG